MKGPGLRLSPGARDREWPFPSQGHRPGLGQWEWRAWTVVEEPLEKHLLTFHVGGDRQEQIFHRLIKSFKLTKFLELKERQKERE